MTTQPKPTKKPKPEPKLEIYLGNDKPLFLDFIDKDGKKK